MVRVRVFCPSDLPPEDSAGLSLSAAEAGLLNDCHSLSAPVGEACDEPGVRRAFWPQLGRFLPG